MWFSAGDERGERGRGLKVGRKWVEWISETVEYEKDSGFWEPEGSVGGKDTRMGDIRKRQNVSQKRLRSRECNVVSIPTSLSVSFATSAYVRSTHPRTQ